MRTTWMLAAVLGATYALPGGHAEVGSFGIVELTPDDTPAMATLHVRLTLANTSSARPWAFDATRVTLDAGSIHEHPTFASGDLATLPIAVVDRGESATLDLYFVLPHDLSGVQVSWPVATDLGTRIEHTRVVDIRVASPEATRMLAKSRHWWFDPAHEWPRFYRRDGILVPRPPTHVLVTGPRSS